MTNPPNRPDAGDPSAGPQPNRPLPSETATTVFSLNSAGTEPADESRSTPRSASAPAAQSEAESPAVQQYQRVQAALASRYQLTSVLASTRLSTLYRAVDLTTSRDVVIKTLWTDRVKIPQQRRWFARERALLERLRHANLVVGYGGGMAEGLEWICLEYLDGPDLTRLVRIGGPLAPETAVRFISEAAAGLQCLHDLGVVHRDVKPRNLVLDGEGRVRVIDLGIALTHLAGDNCPDPEACLLGTPHYLSPEQAEDASQVTPASDLYSLGCTLYFLLTGESPVEGLPTQKCLAAHRQGAHTPLAKARRGLSASLCEFCERLLSVRPGDRPQSAGEVVAWCRAYLEDYRARAKTMLAANGYPASSAAEDVVSFQGSMT